MKRSRPDTSGEYQQWFDQVFTDIVCSSDVRELARREASRLAAPDGPLPQQSDFEASRPYLRKCLENMSIGEIQGLSDQEAAALWARGACGAAKYRLRGGMRHAEPHRLGRRRRGSEQVSRSDSEDDD